jgi:YVTN family beta-propeller protein
VKRLRVIVAAGCFIVVSAVMPTHPGLAAPPVQTQSVAATSTLAVITTISVGAGPLGVAVNQMDDTVYVTNNGSTTVSVINGRTGTVDATITVGNGPFGVAVDQGDDTVYVTNSIGNRVGDQRPNRHGG